MHYYKRNLGDYAKKAGRLSMLQHGAYTLLLDACYDREEFPTLAQAIEWTWASTKEEEEAVAFVLRKFFELQGDVFVQKRVQEELAEYRAKSSINKRIATERETKRKESATNRAQGVNAPPPNHKPLTKNQEPRTTDEPEGFSEFWQAYPSKKAKPAALRAFKAAKINGDLSVVLADIETKSQSEAWKKGNGQFIPMPATYLNQRRWEDGGDSNAANPPLGNFI